jgi:hypothetical protein
MRYSDPSIRIPLGRARELRATPSPAVVGAIRAMADATDVVWPAHYLLTFAKQHNLPWPLMKAMMEESIRDNATETLTVDNEWIWAAKSATKEWPAFRQRVLTALGKGPLTEDELCAALAGGWPSDPAAREQNVSVALGALTRAHAVEVTQNAPEAPLRFGWPANLAADR